MKEVKYLDIKLGGSGRNILRKEKKIWLKKAQTNAAQLIAQVGRSYDKVTVGKQVMVTALLFGKAVVIATKTTIKKFKP